MLTSTLVHLRALAPGELPNTTGQFGHAAFLALVESVAPELAQALHDLDARKPFTVSALRVSDRARGDFAASSRTWRLREGARCSMRFTILDPALFAFFQSAFITATPTATIRLQSVPFTVEEVITTPRDDGWTGYTTFAELWARATSTQTIALRFHSPTAFSIGDTGTGKQFVLLPEPWRVFDSLCRRWNEFADTPICEPHQLRAWIERNVLVSEYDAHTEILCFDRFAQKGFVGNVVYEVRRDDAEMLRTLNALADFALYAGVGYRTTWGMGQCRRIVA